VIVIVIDSEHQSHCMVFHPHSVKCRTARCSWDTLSRLMYSFHSFSSSFIHFALFLLTISHIDNIRVKLISFSISFALVFKKSFVCLFFSLSQEQGTMDGVEKWESDEILAFIKELQDAAARFEFDLHFFFL